MTKVQNQTQFFSLGDYQWVTAVWPLLYFPYTARVKHFFDGIANKICVAQA